MSIQNKIQALKERGSSKEEIYLAMLQDGHKVNDIEKYFAAATSHEDHQQRTVRIMLLVGAVLVGAGVFSFVAANWVGMNDTAKVGTIVLGMVIAYLLGFLMSEKYGAERTGSALYLIGTFIFGAGIFLVAQIYNIEAHWPNGFTLWMLGSFAAAALLKQEMVLVLGVIVGFFAVFGYAVTTILSPLIGTTSSKTSTFLLLVVALVSVAMLSYQSYKLNKA